MTESGDAQTRFALNDGILLLEVPRSEFGPASFQQLQCTRPVGPDDLRAFDAAVLHHLSGCGSRWGPVLAIAPGLLALAVVAVVAGCVLSQLDPTSVVGGWMFWVGIPVGVITYVASKVGARRLASPLRQIQLDAGLVPGMVDEIEHSRGLELIASHGISFELERALPES